MFAESHEVVPAAPGAEALLRRALARLDLPHDAETCVAAWRAFSLEVDHGFLGLPPGYDAPEAIELDGRSYDGPLIAAVIEDGLAAIARQQRKRAERAAEIRRDAIEAKLAALPKSRIVRG